MTLINNPQEFADNFDKVVGNYIRDELKPILMKKAEDEIDGMLAKLVLHASSNYRMERHGEELHITVINESNKRFL